MDDFGIKDVMLRSKDSFTKTDELIHAYLIEHFDQVSMLTIQSLAEKTKTSPAAISRFCKKIGVENFQTLKVEISAEKSTADIIDPESLLDIQAPSEMRTQLMQAAVQGMNEALQVNSDESLQEIIEVIRSKNIIYTSGVGLSKLTADNIYQKWSRVGKTVFVVNDKDLTISTMKTMKHDALFWGISNSGNSVDVNDMMKVARENDIVTLGLTQHASSKLVEQSDYLIFTGKLSPKPSALTNTIYAQLMAVDLLYLMYVSQEKDKQKIISGETFLDF